MSPTTLSYIGNILLLLFSDANAVNAYLFQIAIASKFLNVLTPTNYISYFYKLLFYDEPLWG